MRVCDFFSVKRVFIRPPLCHHNISIYRLLRARGNAGRYAHIFPRCLSAKSIQIRESSRSFNTIGKLSSRTSFGARRHDRSADDECLAVSWRRNAHASAGKKPNAPTAYPRHITYARIEEREIAKSLVGRLVKVGAPRGPRNRLRPRAPECGQRDRMMSFRARRRTTYARPRGRRARAHSGCRKRARSHASSSRSGTRRTFVVVVVRGRFWRTTFVPRDRSEDDVVDTTRKCLYARPPDDATAMIEKKL